MREKEFLSIDEVAETLGVSRMTICRLRDSGQLNFSKIGRIYRCSRKDLDGYIAKTATQKTEGTNLPDHDREE